MNSKIQPIPVPMFRTANNLNEAMFEIKQHTYPYDPNTIHSLVMMYHNTLLKEVARPVQLPAGRTMNCEPTRYLETSEVKRILEQQGFSVEVDEPED